MKQILKLIILSLIVSRFVVASAHAEDEICAAVYPCLENGEILPDFNKPGFCGDHYRAICMKAKASLISDELVACQQENTKFKNEGVKLSKTIRNLRKKLSRSK